MKKYSVFVEGRNLLLNIDGQEKKVGFYTTRYVEAYETNEAKYIALNLIQYDPKLMDNILNKESDLPRINVEKIEEIFEVDIPSPTGFTFFLEEDS
ncbi:MAG: hypothetical protein PVG39_17650 [Desulfobacteraceae bacterium]|jgi:hypothetical protein